MATSSPKAIESAERKELFSSATNESSNASNAALEAAYRKTDVRLLAWYAFVYLILKIESHNITNAAIMNMEAGDDIRHQLGSLTSEQWALILSIFHYPYMVFEPFSTLLLKKFTPRKWMSRMMVSWGIVAMCHAATQNFGSLLARRFLLGLVEAGFLPGVLYHMSFWYPHERLPLRIAFLCAFSQLAGTISGLLAFAISFLDGKGGLAGWRWMFIIEGAPAVLCAVYTFFDLPNYPEEATFLTEAQCARLSANLIGTQPNSQDKTWDLEQIQTLLSDPITYAFLLIWICHAVGVRARMIA